MADEIAAPAAEPSIQDIEKKLASLDLDTPPTQPEGEAAEPQEAGATKATEEPAGEPQALESAESEEDREEVLRDGSRIKISELKRGYVPDHERKLNEFAQRERAFAQATVGFNQAQQEMVRQLNHAVQYVGSQLPRPPDPNLAHTDPFTYLQQDAQYKAKKAEFDQLVYARNQTYQRYRAQQAYAMQAHVARQAELTYQKLPDLRDPVKRTKWLEAGKELAREAGLTQAEWNSVNDSRLFWILNQAIKNRANEKALERAKAKQGELRADLEKARTAVQSPVRRRTSNEIANDSLKAQMKALAKNPNSPRVQEDVLSNPAWDRMHPIH
jgi:hypothetical protein